MFTDASGHTAKWLSSAVSAVKNIASKMASAVKTTASKVASTVKTTASKVVSTVKTTASKVVTAVKSTAGKAVSAVKTTASKVASAVSNTVQTAKKAAKAVVNTAAAVYNKSVTKVQEVNQAVRQGYNNVNAAVQSTYRQTKEYVQQRTEEIKQKVIEFSCGTAEKLNNAWESTVNWAGNAWTDVKNFTGGFAVSLVKDLVVEPIVQLIGVGEYILTGKTNCYNELTRNIEEFENGIIDRYVTNIDAYYAGKITGDIVSIVIGAYEMAGGISTISSSITPTVVGGGLTMTGEAAIVGVPAIAVSIPVAIEGIAVTTVGVATVGSSVGNLFMDINGVSNYYDNYNIDYSKWNKGSFDSPEDSLNKHFIKHGDEVGAITKEQYINKALEFKKNLKGAKTSPVDGYTEGVIRYSKNGKYIDLAPDGTIVSFGKK